MKKYLFLFVLIFSSKLMAQAPQSFGYQAVIRNSSNALVINSTIRIQVSILQSLATGTPVYVEFHIITTNINGLATLDVGNGGVISGTFNAIDWSAGPYFIKTEIDLTGGTNFTITGTSQLLSVPFALHAQTATSGGTLNTAYNSGGAGNGRIINANTGAVSIDGFDGFLVNGTEGFGAVSPSGAGTKMFFNPRKAAFRSGSINDNQWNDFNIGTYSTAFGLSPIASGICAVAIGINSNASGNYSFATGAITEATGSESAAFNFRCKANGTSSFSAGERNTAHSFGEAVFGVHATDYIASSTGSFNQNDRLFVVGNGSSMSNRSNALTILKNGFMGIRKQVPTQALDVNGNILVSGTIINESYTDATLQNGWVNFGSTYGNAQYYKDKENRVHLRGLVANGIFGVPIFNLPSGYRPFNQLIFTVTANNAYGRIDVDSFGSVILTVGSNAFVSLDGISFRAEQ
jgi:hypothetical protein